MKDLEKIKEFFLKDRAMTAAYEAKEEYFKPSIRKDKSFPNFLYVDIAYPAGSGVLSIGGDKTMSGQDRETGAAKALAMGNAVVKKLQAKYNIEDIEVNDLKNGKVQVFAVSDDFIKMSSPSLDEGGVAGWKKASMSMIKHIQKQLDDMGVKYEMGDTPYAPFKTIYKPINKSDDWYDKFNDLIFRANLKSVVKTSMDEAKEEDKVDTITMDVPLFIRMLEYSREDAAEDMDLHDVTEKAISLGKERGILQMDDYDEIIGTTKEIKEGMGGQLDEPYFIEISVRDARKALDLFQDRYRKSNIEMYGSNVYAANTPEDIYDLYYDLTSQDIEILDSSDFEEDLDNQDMEENVAPNHNGKAAPYGSGYKPLEEKIAKALDQINEELCPAGKAYRKRRMAAGEKSSAYLSGRAVKVCKGQMSGKKKKK